MSRYGSRWAHPLVETVKIQKLLGSCMKHPKHTSQAVIKKMEDMPTLGDSQVTAILPLTQTNPLGDTTAENDNKMLSSAFIETPDFRTLIESDDRTVVVGRRGTGKSALFINLKNLNIL